jgi:hypothetical protein
MFTYQTVLNVLGVLILPMLFFVWREMRRVRDNDLKHIQDGLDRIEAKLEAHLSWHLDH